MGVAVRTEECVYQVHAQISEVATGSLIHQNKEVNHVVPQVVLILRESLGVVPPENYPDASNGFFVYPPFWRFRGSQLKFENLLRSASSSVIP
jgi:hypothetical protein